MPKSEFESEVPIVGGQMHVAGPVKPLDGDSPDDPPSHILWMIDQDGRTMPGLARHVDAAAGAWAGSADARPDWVDGDAQASGLIVTPTADGARTFAWTQHVQLRIQGESAA
jgi:hypothetical protein